jgi:molybdopterin converting factor subunit 1
MNVRVLYFAAVRDLAGVAEESLEVPAEVRDVASLRLFLEAHRPELAGRLVSVRFAINGAFAEDASALREGDTVALIPPVAGG